MLKEPAHFFCCAAPLASHSLHKVNIVASAGETLTALGLNFGSYDFTPTVVPETDEVCRTTSWTSDTALTCIKAAPVTPKPAFLRVIVGSVAGTRAAYDFTFDAAVLTVRSKDFNSFSDLLSYASSFFVQFASGNAPITVTTASVTIMGLNFGFGP